MSMSYYERIRGSAPVRQQSIVNASSPEPVSRPNISGMEGMMNEPSALSKHVETQEKADKFGNYVEQNPQMKSAMDKVTQYVQQLKAENPDMNPEQAQNLIQLYINREFL